MKTWQILLTLALTAALTLGLVGVNRAEAAPVSDGATTHVVRPGENLFRIALKYGLSTQALAAANGIRCPPCTIRVGQILNIPSSGSVRSLTVEPGRKAQPTCPYGARRNGSCIELDDQERNGQPFWGMTGCFRYVGGATNGGYQQMPNTACPSLGTSNPGSGGPVYQWVRTANLWNNADYSGKEMYATRVCDGAWCYYRPCRNVTLVGETVILNDPSHPPVPRAQACKEYDTAMAAMQLNLGSFSTQEELQAKLNEVWEGMKAHPKEVVILASVAGVTYILATNPAAVELLGQVILQAAGYIGAFITAYPAVAIGALVLGGTALLVYAVIKSRQRDW